jgi:hypothetical protein
LSETRINGVLGHAQILIKAKMVDLKNKENDGTSFTII